MMVAPLSSAWTDDTSMKKLCKEQQKNPEQNNLVSFVSVSPPVSSHFILPYTKAHP